MLTELINEEMQQTVTYRRGEDGHGVVQNAVKHMPTDPVTHCPILGADDAVPALMA